MWVCDYVAKTVCVVCFLKGLQTQAKQKQPHVDGLVGTNEFYGEIIGTFIESHGKIIKKHGKS